MLSPQSRAALKMAGLTDEEIDQATARASNNTGPVSAVGENRKSSRSGASQGKRRSKREIIEKSSLMKVNDDSGTGYSYVSESVAKQNQESKEKDKMDEEEPDDDDLLAQAIAQSLENPNRNNSASTSSSAPRTNVQSHVSPMETDEREDVDQEEEMMRAELLSLGLAEEDIEFQLEWYRKQNKNKIQTTSASSSSQIGRQEIDLTNSPVPARNSQLADRRNRIGLYERSSQEEKELEEQRQRTERSEKLRAELFRPPAAPNPVQAIPLGDDEYDAMLEIAIQESLR